MLQGLSPESADAERVTAANSENVRATPTALYVNSPRGGTRHVLPSGGLVRIGRGADATIVVDDPRVSRLHAIIHVTEPIAISDVGSANGTFVGGERLRASEPRTLAHGETFFMGDSALVLRPSGLSAPPPDRVVALTELNAHVEAPGCFASFCEATGSSLALLKVRCSRPSETQWVEAILCEFLASRSDRVFRLGGGDIAIGVQAHSAADATALERQALQRLASWSIIGNVASTFVSIGGADGRNIKEAALEFFRGTGIVSLRRGSIVIRDPAMAHLRKTLLRVAGTSVSLLILGETGVGKDVMAAMLHELSPRSGKPFVRLNCASLPEPLFESELFGYERGAFTGASATKAGLLEAADGGTVFLDEIGDLALPLQAKLLRAIESCEVTRVGGLSPRKIDVRFVAATNHPLPVEVKEGRFRRDLYHRLNTFTLTVPPLRDRRAEIEPLARHFLQEACQRFDLRPVDLSPASIAALEEHPWPGNVRELRNIVERAILLTEDPVLQPQHLGLPSSTTDAGCEAAWVRGGLKAAMPTVEASASVLAASGRSVSESRNIEDALNRCGGNQSRAAALLGIPRRTLVRRIAKMGLPRPRSSQS